MKRIEYLGVLILLLISGMVGCKSTPAAPPPGQTEPPVEPTEEPQAQWEVVLQTKPEQFVRMAAFLDETFGVTGGADSAGKAHYTTDGGQTWTMADSSGG